MFQGTIPSIYKGLSTSSRCPSHSSVQFIAECAFGQKFTRSPHIHRQFQQQQKKKTLFTSLTTILPPSQFGLRDLGDAEKKGKEGRAAVALKHVLPENLKPWHALRALSEGAPDPLSTPPLTHRAGTVSCWTATGSKELSGAGHSTAVHKHRPTTVRLDLASSPSPKVGLH